ncbi:MAG: hypothetical protein L0Y54_07775, partial [Sporichthyaceae bacterium]|nr:hypothetical protein [Sporichthyaceae bacterium]
MRPAKIAIAVAVPLLLAGLTGCAGDAAGATGSDTASSREDREEQMLQFTECLREHGLDVEDPGENGELGLQLRGSGDGPDPETREALEACEEFSPMRGEDLEELRNDPEFQEAQLR